MQIYINILKYIELAFGSLRNKTDKNIFDFLPTNSTDCEKQIIKF